VGDLEQQLVDGLARVEAIQSELKEAEAVGAERGQLLADMEAASAATAVGQCRSNR
jgi:hypothetical protein